MRPNVRNETSGIAVRYVTPAPTRYLRYVTPTPTRYLRYVTPTPTKYLSSHSRKTSTHGAKLRCYD